MPIGIEYSNYKGIVYGLNSQSLDDIVNVPSH